MAQEPLSMETMAQCGNCHELYPLDALEGDRFPRLLACGHAFCSRCLVALSASPAVISGNTVSVVSGVMPTISIKCPACALTTLLTSIEKDLKPAEQLIRFFHALMDSLIEDPGARCLHCQSVAQIYCNVCGHDQCSVCSFRIHSTKPGSSHPLGVLLPSPRPPPPVLSSSAPGQAPALDPAMGDTKQSTPTIAVASAAPAQTQSRVVADVDDEKRAPPPADAERLLGPFASTPRSSNGAIAQPEVNAQPDMKRPPSIPSVPAVQPTQAPMTSPQPAPQPQTPREMHAHVAPVPPSPTIATTSVSVSHSRSPSLGHGHGQCAEHAEPLSMFCRSCSAIVCAICNQFGGHKGHDADLITNCAAAARVSMQTLLSSCQPTVERLAERKQHIVKTQAEVEKKAAAALETVNNAIGVAIQRLKERQTALTTQVNASKNGKLADLQRAFAECDAAISAIAATRKVITDSVAQDKDALAYLQAHNAMQAKMQATLVAAAKPTTTTLPSSNIVVSMSTYDVSTAISQFGQAGVPDQPAIVDCKAIDVARGTAVVGWKLGSEDAGPIREFELQSVQRRPRAGSDAHTRNSISATMRPPQAPLSESKRKTVKEKEAVSRTTWYRGPATSFTVSNLELAPGSAVSYAFRVRARNDAGWSFWSEDRPVDTTPSSSTTPASATPSPSASPSSLSPSTPRSSQSAAPMLSPLPIAALSAPPSLASPLASPTPAPPRPSPKNSEVKIEPFVAAPLPSPRDASAARPSIPPAARPGPGTIAMTAGAAVFVGASAPAQGSAGDVKVFSGTMKPSLTMSKPAEIKESKESKEKHVAVPPLGSPPGTNYIPPQAFTSMKWVPSINGFEDAVFVYPPPPLSSPIASVSAAPAAGVPRGALTPRSPASSPPVSPPSDGPKPEFITEGYLMKRPNDATIFGQWVKRWFVLKQAQGTLVYYKTKEEAGKSGTIFCQLRDIDPAKRMAPGKDKRQFLIQLTSIDGMNVLQAANQDEQDLWIHSINWARELVRMGRSGPQPPTPHPPKPQAKWPPHDADTRVAQLVEVMGSSIPVENIVQALQDTDWIVNKAIPLLLSSTH